MSELSDDLEEILEQIKNDTINENDLQLFKREQLDGLHFVEIVDLQCFYISQPHLVNDLPYKLNDKIRKLNKRINKGTIYGMD